MTDDPAQQARFDADCAGGLPRTSRWIGPHSRDLVPDLEAIFLRRRSAMSTAEAIATMRTDYDVTVGFDATGRVTIEERR